MFNQFPPLSALPVGIPRLKGTRVASADVPVRIEASKGRILIRSVESGKLVGFIAKGKLTSLVGGVIKT